MTLSSLLTDDLDTFFNSSDFAVDATLNGDTTITVIFDDDYDLIAAGEAGIGGSEPMVKCKTSDVQGVELLTLAINGTVYNIAGPPEPDGTGITILKLEEQD